MEEAEAELTWNRETVPKVLKIVSTRLPQRDVTSFLLVSPWILRTLVSYPSLWLVLDLREMGNAGNRLIAALSLPRYRYVKQIKLEFAQDIEDKHLELLKSKCLDSLQNLESLNLNGCQKISDNGIEAIITACPTLKVFSIYWNVRVTDWGIKHLVNCCKNVTNLNLSGCKNITDKSLQLVAENYPKLEFLNLTRCIKLTDRGLQQILLECSSLQSLNVYAVSGFTDEAYKRISLLPHLKCLDLCGAQNISDAGLACIANCSNIVSLNLTCLFGIVGVTDKCLEALSRSCSNTLATLDVNALRDGVVMNCFICSPI